MKKLFAAIIALTASIAFGATTVPVQLLNPTGSTSGQTIVSSGPGNAPAWGNIPVANVTGAPSLSGNNTWTGSQTFSSTITPSQTGGIVGTTTNNNANAGSIGEFVQQGFPSVSVTNATPTNAVSISLTAGDWDVTGYVQYQAGSGATVTAALGGISTTSATLPASGFYSFMGGISAPSTTAAGVIAPIQRISLTSTTTVYLVAEAVYTGASCVATGFIRARRVR
jgi:hypothetical protein